MRIGVWYFLIAKDDILLSLAEFVLSARKLWGLFTIKERRRGREMIKQMSVDGGDAYIVLNGPSSARQPLERLKGKTVFFVNQGFRHPSYQAIAPTFHVFIDTKLINGVWDVGWIDTILKMVPTITFVMPASWASHPVILPYVRRGVRILWIDSCIGGIRGTGVSGACFDLAARLGYARIFFTGFEATSFPAMLLEQSTHFYGNDCDDNLDPDEIETGYYFNLRQIHELNLFARKHRLKGPEFINLTDGGILNMFRRMRFEDVC